MKHGLPDPAVQQLCAVFARHPEVEKVLLYGSRAMGNYRKGSDIDLTICDTGGMNQEILFRILDEIDQLLLVYMIDLSILRDIKNPDFQDQIRRFGVPFYIKEKAPAKASSQPSAA